MYFQMSAQDILALTKSCVMRVRESASVILGYVLIALGTV